MINFENTHSSREEEKKELVSKIHKAIMKCEKHCNEGYILENGVAKICDCCLMYFNMLQDYKDVEISVVDPEYEAFQNNKKQTFTNFHKEKCIECGKEFMTNLKNRARCDECYKKLSSDFRMAGRFFAEEHNK